MKTVIINKYYVQMYEFGFSSSTKARTIIAATEEEAIEKTRHDEWWYNEGQGKGYKKLLFPITFKAEIIKQ